MGESERNRLGRNLKSAPWFNFLRRWLLRYMYIRNQLVCFLSLHLMNRSTNKKVKSSFQLNVCGSHTSKGHNKTGSNDYHHLIWTFFFLTCWLPTALYNLGSSISNVVNLVALYFCWYHLTVGHRSVWNLLHKILQITLKLSSYSQSVTSLLTIQSFCVCCRLAFMKTN